MKFSPDMSLEEKKRLAREHEINQQKAKDFMTIAISEQTEENLERAKKAVFGKEQ